jgi:hypothetical protein
MFARKLLCAAAFGMLATSGIVRAQDGYGEGQLAVQEQVPPTLQYNYYFPTPGTNGIPARMYLCPRPTPAHVGYTYITYQALAPHEFLWRHQAVYYRPYAGGFTITRVRWE